ncbi:uncharacterized protein J3D65DRAFT_444106 [Phyllosticta citribraziliensis]|uniref:Uncharacterized protein n=1 Tax=Phyllosticta citribraziliensis TaxID=989973 RepID=A0ABR1LKX0_9PEZI
MNLRRKATIQKSGKEGQKGWLGQARRRIGSTMNQTSKTKTNKITQHGYIQTSRFPTHVHHYPLVLPREMKSAALASVVHRRPVPPRHAPSTVAYMYPLAARRPVQPSPNARSRPCLPVCRTLHAAVMALQAHSWQRWSFRLVNLSARALSFATVFARTAWGGKDDTTTPLPSLQKSSGRRMDQWVAEYMDLTTKRQLHSAAAYASLLPHLQHQEQNNLARSTAPLIWRCMLSMSPQPTDDSP